MKGNFLNLSSEPWIRNNFQWAQHGLSFTQCGLCKQQALGPFAQVSRPHEKKSDINQTNQEQ